MTVLNQIFRLRTRGIFKKLKILSFSSEARHTVTRITLFQFADTTSMSVPQFKDFSGARESASSPAFNKDQRSYSFRPKNTQIISLPTAPRQSPRHPINRHVTCNLRCSIATSDAPMHHLTLQTDRHNSAISRRISRFQARSPSSRPEKPVFMQSSAMRTQASVLDLQLQMDTLPRGPCHGFAIDALSRTLRPVSRHHVRSGT